MDTRRIDKMPPDTAEKMPQWVKQKGTQGCLWRWTTLQASLKQDLNETKPADAYLLLSRKEVMKSVTDATVIEVPAIVLQEGHMHCREIAMQRYLADAGIALGDSAPSIYLRSVDNSDAQEAYKAQRQSRPWEYQSQESVVVLYDEPIPHLSFGHPDGVEDIDLNVARLYDVQTEAQGRYDSYVIGHSLSPDGLFTFLMHFDKQDKEGVRLVPMAECALPKDAPIEWYFEDSYTTDVLLRLLPRIEHARQLNAKLSFRRAQQKIAKALRVKTPPFASPYYHLDITPLSLFHDVAIRRGWVPKGERVFDGLDAAAEKPSKPSHRIETSIQDTPFNIDHGHKAIVERFLATRLQQEALAMAEESGVREQAGKIHEVLRQARIIELPWKFYWKQVEKAAVTMSNATLVGMGKTGYQSSTWVDLAKRWRDLRQDDETAFREIEERIPAMMRRIDWQPTLPFPVCWLGYDLPVGGNITTTDGRHGDFLSIAYQLGSNINPSKEGLPYLYGHLVTKDAVYAFFTYIREGAGGSESTGECFALVEREQEWNHPEAYSGMVLNATMAFIEDHQIVIEQVSKKRAARAHKKVDPRLKRKQNQPSPYYTVYIKDGVYDVKKEPVREGARGPLEYSHDRAGGTYYKIKRGPLPLGKKERAALLRPRTDGHGYQVFEEEKPWGEWAEAVKKRGARPKHPDEWIAILKWKRRETIVRPDLPNYIPSVRRSEKHKEGNRNNDEHL